MKRRIHEYDTAEIAVTYDVARCIHAAECVHGLPRVFDPERKPWIDPSRATADEIAATVRRCPTGALQYERRDGGSAEEPATRNTLRVVADGPLYLEGRLRLHLPDGETLEETRLALCRCGASSNKPLCDNSHVEAGFEDPTGTVRGNLRPADEAAAGEVLELRLASDGPVLLSGPARVVGADGSSVEGAKGALCRCGHSSTKPFCDGSHKKAGFEAD